MNNCNCVNCNILFDCQTDIMLCEDCQALFDLDKLWLDHDNNLIDALDFNENENIRNKYKLEAQDD